MKFNILLENAINFSDIIFSLQVVLLQNGFEQFNRIKVKIRSHFKNLANYEEDEKILLFLAKTQILPPFNLLLFLFSHKGEERYWTSKI